MKYIVIFALFILATGGYWLWNYVSIPADNKVVIDQNEERQVYESSTYGFSFEVPEGEDTYQYLPEFVAVGQSIEDGFNAEVEVVVAKSGEEGGYENFESFLFDSVRNMCAADGPSETIYCSELTEQESFESDSGLSGVHFYATRVHENFRTSERKEEKFGPFIAFNIQANTPDSKFSALIVRPAVSKSVMEIHTSLVEEIASSIKMNLVE